MKLFTAIIGCVLIAAGSLVAEPGDLDLAVEGEHVSVRADRVLLADLVSALEREAGVDLNIGELDDRKVTLSHEHVSIDALLAKLNINYALIYIYDSDTGEVELDGGWGVSYKGGQPVRNSLLIPLNQERILKQAMRPYEEQVTNGLPSVYPVIYPAAVEVDGDLSDWPSNMPWHVVGGRMGSYHQRPFHLDPAHVPAYPPMNNIDASFTWGAMMDDDNLYVGVTVYDDYKIVHESDDLNLIFLDDSVEFYIDGGNEKGTKYDHNDAQIAIARGEDWDDPTAPRISPWRGYGQGVPGSESGTKVIIVNTENGYRAEAAIPLERFEILPEGNLAFGFNIHVNDDDDGGVRDHKIMWSALEQMEGEQSFHNPSVFGSMSIVDLRSGVSGEEASAE